MRSFGLVDPRVTLSGVCWSGHVTVGQLHRLRSRPSRRNRGASFTRPRSTASHYQGSGGRQFCAQGAEELGSLRVGSPDLLPSPAGRTSDCIQPRERRQGSEIRIFVDSPYEKYVTSEARFWNASGLDVSVNADGVDVRTQSLVALLAGGLAFEVPALCRSGRARRGERGPSLLH